MYGAEAGTGANVMVVLGRRSFLGLGVCKTIVNGWHFETRGSSMDGTWNWSGMVMEKRSSFGIQFMQPWLLARGAGEIRKHLHLDSLAIVCLSVSVLHIRPGTRIKSFTIPHAIDIPIRFLAVAISISFQSWTGEDHLDNRFNSARHCG